MLYLVLQVYLILNFGEITYIKKKSQETLTPNPNTVAFTIAPWSLNFCGLLLP